MGTAHDGPMPDDERSRTPFERPVEPPHGFGDDERSRALRKRPDRTVLAWLEGALGARVTGTRARKGGSSSAIHEVRLRDGTRVVLRRYVLEWVFEEEPDIVEREAGNLTLLEGVDVPTPRVLAADLDGTRSGGTPCLVMSRLPGQVEWFPAAAHLDRWLERLAEVAVPLHAARPPTAFRPFDPYEPNDWAAPPWMRDPTRWERAVEVFHAPPLDPEAVLIHRDFHPGSVLWSRRRVSGVVDWPALCVGPSSVDAFWTFVNLLPRLGLDVAERWLSTWERVEGRTYHPWGEVALLVDVLDGRDDQRTPERVALEDRLARGLAELGVT
jgi:aminoglycoside phosphotransferase (APT) family kinase protein